MKKFYFGGNLSAQTDVHLIRLIIRHVMQVIRLTLFNRLTALAQK